jgi:Ca-activated chloride channel homolog
MSESQIKLATGINKSVLPEKKPNTVFMGVEIRCAGEPTRHTQSVCLVIDTSGSMTRQSKMDLAKRSALDLAKALDPTDHIALVSFATEAKVELESSELGDANALSSALDGMKGGGRTALYDGLSAALRQLEKSSADQSAVRRIILLSDGRPTVGSKGVGQYASLARDMRKSNVRLVAIGVGEAYNERLMIGMAEANQGYWYHIKDLESAGAVFANVTGNVRRLYDSNVAFNVELLARAEISQAYRVQPLLYEAVVDKLESSRYSCYLGDVEVDSIQTVVFRIGLPKMDAGNARLANISLPAFGGETNDVTVDFSAAEPSESAETDSRTRVVFLLAESISNLREAKVSNNATKANQEKKKTELLMEEIESKDMAADPLVKALLGNVKILLGKWKTEEEKKIAIQETTLIRRMDQEETRLYK